MFGCICAGRPVQTNLQAVSETEFVFSLPSPSTLNHLVVFLLPDTIIPPTHGATVHIRFPGRTDFQLLGAISANKPSAIFRVRDIPDSTTEEGECILGISVALAEVVETALATLNTGNGAMVLAKKQPVLGVNEKAILAKRIIGHAFNYLGSFSKDFGTGDGEVVPMRAFREWWSKFETRLQRDPAFLEREEV
ncbi:hypothetical protein EDC01DRAFT_689813 [Geopyxis carbonaria]|nr:hypothetical protein EDC01DRAFT_689813 [Geopyxis carbonaria]